MFMSGAGEDELGRAGASIGLARADRLDGPWTVAAEPLLPLSERLENAAVFHDDVTQLWWLLANRVTAVPGLDGALFTDAILAYWAPSWDGFTTERSTVLLDGSTCTWSSVIGMPSGAPVGDRVALFYDGRADGSTGHMSRDVGMCLLSMPRCPPDSS
jgi:hypothetical protein